MGNWTATKLTAASGRQLAPGVVPPGPVTFGLDASQTTSTEFSQDLTWFPGATTGSLYGSAGNGLPSWGGVFASAYVSAGYTITWSAKDFDINAFTANWDQMPNNNQVHYYTCQHECNKPTSQSPPDLTTYRNFYINTLIPARNAHVNAARIKIGPVFSWFPAAINHNEGTPWQSWVVPGIDYIGWDQYYAVGVANDPEAFVSLPISSGVTNGVPVLIREFGVSGSFTDSQANDFLTAVVPVYKEQANLLSVAYFNASNGTSGARLTPSGRPLSFANWENVVANQ